MDSARRAGGVENAGVLPRGQRAMWGACVLFVLGLTGPTGAGKGAVAARLAERGFVRIDADQEARAVVEPGSPCLAALVRVFGAEILKEDGSLDRAALAKLAFAGGRVAELNATTHPYIRARIEYTLAELAQRGVHYVVLDAPALFESGADRICDRVAAVMAPAKDRLARIMRRDGLTLKQARERLLAQPEESFYTQRADAVLQNGGDESALEREADRLYEAVASGRL